MHDDRGEATEKISKLPVTLSFTQRITYVWYGWEWGWLGGLGELGDGIKIVKILREKHTDGSCRSVRRESLTGGTLFNFPPKPPSKEGETAARERGGGSEGQARGMERKRRQPSLPRSLPINQSMT
jgi:hypothetical protein